MESEIEIVCKICIWAEGIDLDLCIQEEEICSDVVTEILAFPTLTLAISPGTWSICYFFYYSKVSEVLCSVLVTLSEILGTLSGEMSLCFEIYHLGNDGIEI